MIRCSMTGADCRSAAFGCGGSIPSLPTSFRSDDGPKGSSCRFEPAQGSTRDGEEGVTKAAVAATPGPERLYGGSRVRVVPVGSWEVASELLR